VCCHGDNRDLTQFLPLPDPPNQGQTVFPAKLNVDGWRTWSDGLLDELTDQIAGTPLFSVLQGILEDTLDYGIHLAVFVQAYLGFVLEGKKTIDSRFGVNRNSPFQQVKNGDLLILKESSGPICGVCVISHAWYYHLNPASWSEIEKYASALCMDDSHFWVKKRSACFATLMRLENVIRLRDISVQKLDPRGWVVLKNVKTQRSLL